MKLSSQKHVEEVTQWLESMGNKQVEIKDRIAKVPAMLQTNGLLLTLTTLLGSKHTGDQRIGKQLSSYTLTLLTNTETEEQQSDLITQTINALSSATLEQYLYCMENITQRVNWIKQVSRALYPSESNENLS